MQANVFVDPKDVSFQDVVFGEGTVVAATTGSYLASTVVHGLNTFGPAHGGNATTGTPVSPPPDNIRTSLRPPATTIVGGIPICGTSTFLWAIPWEFSVVGAARVAFATANHRAASSLFCNATIDKAGAGPFCRTINGVTC